MYKVSRGTLRGNLDTYTGDAANVIWSAEQKNLSIDMAITSAWPEIYHKGRLEFLLAAGSYVYIVNHFVPEHSIASATRAPYGPAQVWVSLEAGAASPRRYRQLRRSVSCRVEGAAWALQFDKEFVDTYGGHAIEVLYEQMYPTLSSDEAETEVPEDYLLPRALFELCGQMTLKGHHTDVATFAKERPNFWEQAERAKRRHMRLALPRSIAIRSEG